MYAVTSIALLLTLSNVSIINLPSSSFSAYTFPNEKIFIRITPNAIDIPKTKICLFTLLLPLIGDINSAQDFSEFTSQI
jgi:hypothetical protein